VSRKQIVILVVVGVAAILGIAGMWLHMHSWRPRVITIQGAVIRKDDDPRKELPISDAEVTASDGISSASTQSDSAGYFIIRFQGGVWPNQTLQLSFRHPDYDPVDLKFRTGFRSVDKELHIAKMEAIPEQPATQADRPGSVVSNIRIRYTENSETDVNIGSAVRTFQVVNKGNVPCNQQLPCSPDRNWKAASNSVSIDAGLGNEFRNIRASCIAGPCPFTRIDTGGMDQAGRNMTVTAVDWSDTATFLVEAEVFHAAISSNVRESYPVVFGRTLNFTLPPTQEGVSIEAEIDGSPMVFPLGPDLYLSWATCTVRDNAGEQKTAVYRCELKPGYKF
jgi:hypothetical protein